VKQALDRELGAIDGLGYKESQQQDGIPLIDQIFCSN
jgi:hypothetical protein